MKARNKFLFFIYGMLNAVFVFQLVKLSTLPSKYIMLIVIAMAITAIIIFYSQFKKQKTFLNKIGKLLLVILSLLLVVANIFIYQTGSFLDKVSSGDIKKDTVSIIVKSDSPYETLDDVKNLVFAKEDENEEIVIEAIDHFETELGQPISIKYYTDYPTMANALINSEIEVIIFNEAYRNIVEDEVESFNEDTKIIYEYNKETVIESGNKTVDSEAFTVMISGIDVYGSMSNNSRSDVNILATVNPLKKEILLVSIPRDYYLPLGCQTGALDKLTHAGIYGIDCTMNTIGNAFNLDIDYYARVNFNSLISVVNAVGGVNVNVDAPFSTGSYNFPAGDNYLDGEKALVFVRDRYHQEGGDRGRGQNQMKVIASLIDKMTSPAIISNYTSVLSSLEGSFQTNLSTSDITSLVKFQINDMSAWSVKQMQVDGTGGTDYAYALGYNAYVMYPDQQTIDQAKAAITETMN